MVRLGREKCGHEGCFTKPSYGVAGSMNSEFCSKHARPGMVNVGNEKCGEEGWFKFTVDKRHTVDEAEVFRQHTSAHKTAAVSDTARLHTGEGTHVHSPTKGGGGSVADVRGTKRKRAGCSDSVANDVVGARWSAFADPRQIVRTRSPAPRAGQIVPETSAEDWMKVELVVRSATPGCDRGREGREQAPRSRDWTNEGGRSSVIGSGGVSSGRVSGSPAMARERLGIGYVDVEQAEENSNVKLELGVSDSSPRADGTL
ncbi:unnamed protein product [Sphacelaria rigidula]